MSAALPYMASRIWDMHDQLRLAHKLKQDPGRVSTDTLAILRNTYRSFLNDVLGIYEETEKSSRDELFPEVIDILIEVRQKARANKNFVFSDFIRDRLATIGIKVNDTKESATYATNLRRN